jgi:hypothetical protein
MTDGSLESAERLLSEATIGKRNGGKFCRKTSNVGIFSDVQQNLKEEAILFFHGDLI